MERAIANGDGFLLIKNIHFYHYTILYLHNCELIIINNGVDLTFASKSVVFIEKHTMIDVKVKRVANGLLYSALQVDDAVLIKLREISEPIVIIDKINKIRTIKNKIIAVTPNQTDMLLLNNLSHVDNMNEKLMLILYLISKNDRFNDIMISMYLSSSITFVDRVKYILLSDLSYKWKLNNIADLLNTSEITVRKKLEKQSLTFNQILMDLRMNHSLKLILTTKTHINIISKKCGFSTTSYFIKQFKKYYGITPKKVSVNFFE